MMVTLGDEDVIEFANLDCQENYQKGEELVQFQPGSYAIQTTFNLICLTLPYNYLNIFIGGHS